MIRLFEAFAGYGGASFALAKAEIPYEVVGYSEINIYAIQCYAQNHRSKNYGDITKINPEDLPDFDLFTGGFPCQPFSTIGLNKGEQDTRGTLFNEIIRICEVKKPKYILLENVKGLTFKTHKATFNTILNELDRIGYKVFWKVLNTKDYGIPQNRERVFFVCYRKDLNVDNFEFPSPTYESNNYETKLTPFIKEVKPLKKYTLNDIIEKEVDKKYYLTDSQMKNIQKRFGKKGKILNLNKISITDLPKEVDSKDKEPKVIYDNKILQGNENTCHTIRGSESSENKMIVKCVDCYNPKIKDESPTITTKSAPNDIRLVEVKLGDTQSEYSHNVYLRNITPKECFRLMGFVNDEIKFDGLSDTQSYKLAGNGWDINLVSLILKQMLNMEGLDE